MTNLWTNVEDLARWEANLLRPSVGGQDFVDLLLTPGRLQNGEAIDYGLGLMLGSHRGLKTVSHAGAWGGFRAEMLRFPEKELAVVVLANFDGILPTRLAYQAANACLNDHALDRGDTDGGQSAAIPPALLADMAGFYRSPETGEMTELTVSGDQLLAELNGRTFRLGALRVTAEMAEFGVLDMPVPIRLVFTPCGIGWHVARSVPGAPTITFFPADPDGDAAPGLTDYVGRYAHPDLLTAWDVSVREGKLTVIYGGNERDILKPAGADAFRAPNISLRFTRNAAGEVTALSFETERLRHLSLTRL